MIEAAPQLFRQPLSVSHLDLTVTRPAEAGDDTHQTMSVSPGYSSLPETGASPETLSIGPALRTDTIRICPAVFSRLEESDKGHPDRA